MLSTFLSCPYLSSNLPVPFSDIIGGPISNARRHQASLWQMTALVAERGGLGAASACQAGVKERGAVQTFDAAAGGGDCQEANC